MELNELKGKKVFVKLRDGGIYSGVIDRIEGHIIFLTDRYNQSVMFSIEHILRMTIEEDKK